jgi:hypothetical protein
MRFIAHGRAEKKTSHLFIESLNRKKYFEGKSVERIKM